MNSFEQLFDSASDFVAWCEIGEPQHLFDAIQNEDMGKYTRIAVSVYDLRANKS